MVLALQTEVDIELFEFVEAILDLTIECHVDFNCLDCFHVWQMSLTGLQEANIEDVDCPECHSDLVNSFKQYFSRPQ